MTRKRQLSRHTVTIAIPQDGTAGWVYSRGKGLVEPPRETDLYINKPQGTVEEDTLEFYTRVAIYDGTPLSTLPVFIWQGWEPAGIRLNRPYEIIQTRDFIKFGKDTYFKYIGYYNSDKDWGSRGRPVDPDWSEISEFEIAVNNVETVLELKVNKVLNP